VYDLTGIPIAVAFLTTQPTTERRYTSAPHCRGQSMTSGARDHRDCAEGEVRRRCARVCTREVPARQRQGVGRDCRHDVGSPAAAVMIPFDSDATSEPATRQRIDGPQMS